MMLTTRALTLGIAASFGMAGAALADRAPTLAERESIQAVLIGAGYTSWDKIELDDDRLWEVDDAVKADGVRYDVELGLDYAITREERD